MMTRDQIQTVLDALEYITLHVPFSDEDGIKQSDAAITICEAALAEPEGEPSTVLRLIDTIKYLVGIAERGEGRKARDDELPEQFVLGYVKRLEEAIAEPSEPVAWRYRTKADWNANWSNWVPCSKEQYEDYVKVSKLHGWVYDAQALFAHPASSKPEPDKDLIQALTERDEYHDMADKLAEGIALHFDGDIGEHSSSNSPWDRALDLLDSAACAETMRLSKQAALAEPSEPFSKVLQSATNYDGTWSALVTAPCWLPTGLPLFTHPASKPAPLPELTDDELKPIFQKYGTGRLDGFIAAARAILAASREKK